MFVEGRKSKRYNVRDHGERLSAENRPVTHLGSDLNAEIWKRITLENGSSETRSNEFV